MFGRKKSMSKTEAESPAPDTAATPVDAASLSLEQITELQTLAAAQNAQGDKLTSLQSGVAMIQQQLKAALAETGLEEIDAAGKPFDPNFHEAVSEQESAETPEGHVLQQLRKG